MKSYTKSLPFLPVAELKIRIEPNNMRAGVGVERVVGDKRSGRGEGEAASAAASGGPSRFRFPELHLPPHCQCYRTALQNFLLLVKQNPAPPPPSPYPRLERAICVFSTWAAFLSYGLRLVIASHFSASRVDDRAESRRAGVFRVNPPPRGGALV